MVVLSAIIIGLAVRKWWLAAILCLGVGLLMPLIRPGLPNGFYGVEAAADISVLLVWAVPMWAIVWLVRKYWHVISIPDEPPTPK
jgi:hypothetical protein